MKSIIALTDFHSETPALKIRQEESFEHLIACHGASDAYALLMKRYGVKASQIGTRYVENLELAKAGKDIFERSLFFGERARQIMDRFYDGNPAPPDHLVHVTCTGYLSPSPAQQLVNDKAWSGKTAVSHAYHMGCYAALPAIRMAEGFIATGKSRVDIVHTEMCTLHMDREDHSPEQMVVQTLFADGHIKYSAVPEEGARNGFKVLAIEEFIVPDSQKDMSWVPAPWGMKMSLSRDVPQKLAAQLKPFVEKLCSSADVSFPELLKNAAFAIHPGGPKIIQGVREILEISDPQVEASREVLFERGNMSSATLPHVWQKLLSDKRLLPKQKVLSLAFGPGLTIFGALFESI